MQKAISQAKKMYRTALNNLERISEEVRGTNPIFHPIDLLLQIHSKRSSQLLMKLPPREPGVGSDKPDEFIELPTLGKYKIFSQFSSLVTKYPHTIL